MEPRYGDLCRNFTVRSIRGNKEPLYSLVDGCGHAGLTAHDKHLCQMLFTQEIFRKIFTKVFKSLVWSVGRPLGSYYLECRKWLQSEATSIRSWADPGVVVYMQDLCVAKIRLERKAIIVSDFTLRLLPPVKRNHQRVRTSHVFSFMKFLG